MTIPAGSHSKLWITNTPGKIELFETTESSYVSDDETITDEQPHKKATGNCGHSKTTRRYLATSISVGPYTEGGITYRSTLTNGFICKAYLIPSGVGNLEPTVAVATFDSKTASFDAVSKMRPTVNDGLLLPLASAELAESGTQLKDFVKESRRKYVRAKEKAAKLDLRRAKGLKEFVKDPKTLLEKSATFIRQASRSTAQINLIYQFAVKPTYSDAIATFAILKEYKRRIAQLVTGANKPQRRHYSRPVDGLVTLPTDVYFGGGSAFGTSWRFIRRMEWVTRPKYCASMYFTYDASALQGKLGELNYLLNAFGVNRPLSHLWEAIPYSFVVDWFVNVGDVIGSIEDHLIDPLPIVIRDFSSSLKYEYRARAQFEIVGSTIVDVAYVSRKSYSRSREYPTLWDRLSVRSPNLNQAGLGASLITVKMTGINK